MAGLPFRQVGIVEVQIANGGSVVERRAIWPGAASADQRAQGVAAEFLDLITDDSYGRTMQAADGAAERVEHSLLEGIACRVADIVPARVDDELGKLLDPSPRAGDHSAPPLMVTR